MDLKTFFEQFDTIAEAPGGIQRLRNLILDMAVRGKLVPQDPNDEPALYIVKNALNQREKLCAEKQISQRKSQPPIESEEVPFELPDGWECVRLGEITDIFSGVTKGRKLAGRETQSFPYLRVANVQRWYLDLEVIKEIEIPIEELEKYKLKVGDILLTEGGDWDKLGRSAIWKGEIQDCIHQNHVFRARPLDEGILSEWVVMFTNSLIGRNYFESAAKRTTNLASINMTQLRFCPLPLPPLAEQKRIVAKVDELMGLCDQFEAEKQQRDSLRQRLRASAFAALMNAPTDDALSTAWSFIHQHWHPLTQHPDDVEDVRRSVLQLAFSGSLTPRLEQTESVEQFAKKISKERQRLLEITIFRDSGNIKGEISESEQLFSIPDEWKWIRIGHAFLISSGTTPSRTNPEYFTNGTESWVKTTDLNNDVVMTCEEKITKSATEDCNLKYYPPGTVCVALYGGAGTIGKSGILGIETTINQSVCGIYPNQFIDPCYFHWYIKLIRPIWMNFAASLRKAPNINAGIVNNMVFPLAPLAEQKRIVAKVDELMRECDQLEAQLRQQQQVAEQFAASAVSHLVV